MEAAVNSLPIFNTPLEAGLRALFLLNAAPRRAFDSQRIVYFDYMLVHSEDVGGPTSLHPHTPSQKGELLVRRQLVQEGLALMRSRDLIERRFAATGIKYKATPGGRHVVSMFDSAYAIQLREHAEWVVKSFAGLKDRELEELLKARLDDWDEELIDEVAPGQLPPTDE